MAFAIWITGLPGSGKSTIAKEFAKKIGAEILRLDDIRRYILPDEDPATKTLSDAELNLTYRTLALIAFFLVKNKKNVILDSTDSTGEGRKLCRELIKDFFVVQLTCPQKICEQREAEREDKAGIVDLYKKAREGKLKIPGLGKKYLEEKDPLITIDSSKTSAEEAAKAILSKLKP